jgi:hypothetical protein
VLGGGVGCVGEVSIGRRCRVEGVISLRVRTAYAGYYNTRLFVRSARFTVRGVYTGMNLPVCSQPLGRLHRITCSVRFAGTRHATMAPKDVVQRVLQGQWCLPGAACSCYQMERVEWFMCWHWKVRVGIGWLLVQLLKQHGMKHVE